MIEAYLGREEDEASLDATGVAVVNTRTSIAGQGLKVAYGQIEAVKGIDLELHEGQITTLVGANGAGKSTTLLALSGLVKKAAGRVHVRWPGPDARWRRTRSLPAAWYRWPKAAPR